jgi:hypothetical protein
MIGSLRFAAIGTHPNIAYAVNVLSQFSAYSDTSYGNTPDRKSFRGYIVRYGDATISWRTKKQKSTTTSTTKAEYMALSAACKQAIWTTRLLESFGIFTSPLLVCDNQVSIKISENPVLHQHTKHIDIQFHFVREKVSEGKVYIEYVNTAEILADGFTKGLGAIKLAVFRERVLGTEKAS